MKNIKTILIVIFLISVKCSAQYFEGVITYKITDIPEGRFSYLYCDTTTKATVKNDKVRLESSGDFFDKYYIYSNTPSGEIVYCTIDTIQKYYTVIVKNAGEIYNIGKNPKKFKGKTRKDMKILGYNCKHYCHVSKDSRMDYWITDSIIPQINGLRFIKDKGVILKSIFKSGEYKGITEVVSIEPKPINSKLFKIPADCKPRKSKIPEYMEKKLGFDKKDIPRDSLQHVKDTTTKIDLGKWGEDN